MSVFVAMAGTSGTSGFSGAGFSGPSGTSGFSGPVGSGVQEATISDSFSSSTGAQPSEVKVGRLDVLSFSASTLNAIDFALDVPDDFMTGNAAYVVMSYHMSTAFAGDVVLKLDYDVVDVNGDTTPGSATGNLSQTITPSASAEIHQEATFTIPAVDVTATSQSLRFTLYRDAAAGPDTHTGEWRLENVSVRYVGSVGPSGFSGLSSLSGTSGVSGFSGEGFSGPSGPSGFSGYSGQSGTSGYSGYSGYSGTSGYSGFSGYSGQSGTSGYSGYSGQSGTSGYSGFSGQSGASGYSGYSGTSGYSGYSGYSGFSGYSGTGTSGYSGFSGNNDFHSFLLMGA